jgi:hypothetical protein
VIERVGLTQKASSQSIPAEDARLSCGRPTPEKRLELEQDLEGVERLLSAMQALRVADTQ